jgi:hypothetical protein
MTSLIVALYFSVMVPGQYWPVLVGPYASWEHCDAVRSSVEHQGYETDRCGTMSYPQPGSQYIEIGMQPTMDNGEYHER